MEEVNVDQLKKELEAVNAERLKFLQDVEKLILEDETEMHDDKQENGIDCQSKVDNSNIDSLSI